MGLGDFVKDIGGGLSDLGSAVNDKVGDGVDFVADGAGDFIGSTGLPGSGIIDSGLDHVGDFANLSLDVQGFVTAQGGNFLDVIGGGISTVGGLASDSASAINGDGSWGDVLDNAGGTLSDTWETITDRDFQAYENIFDNDLFPDELSDRADRLQDGTFGEAWDSAFGDDSSGGSSGDGSSGDGGGGGGGGSWLDDIFGNDGLGLGAAMGDDLGALGGGVGSALGGLGGFFGGGFFGGGSGGPVEQGMDRTAAQSSLDALREMRQQLLTLVEDASSAVSALGENWEGADSSRFQHSWAGSRKQCIAAEEGLESMAKALQQQIAQQASTSSR